VDNHLSLKKFSTFKGTILSLNVNRASVISGPELRKQEKEFVKKILRDPLVLFLVLGLGLFVLFDLVASDDAAYDSRVINVDRVHYVTDLVHALI